MLVPAYRYCRVTVADLIAVPDQLVRRPVIRFGRPALTVIVIFVGTRTGTPLLPEASVVVEPRCENAKVPGREVV